jgi:HKD family nuclease
MSLFPNSQAMVMGLPPSFDFLSELASARTIRLATAFAHASGWEMLDAAIANSKAEVYLLTGTSFFQTEPKVLRVWMKLSRSINAKAALHVQKGVTFHPKVLIVEGAKNFAIVGSGNLSRGGLHSNIECATYVGSDVVLPELTKWFDETFNAATPLRDAVVGDYEHKWKALRKRTKELCDEQGKLQDAFATKTAAVMKRWDDAVTTAKRYMKTLEFQKTYAGRKAGGEQIKQFLRYPTFDFDAKGWEGFYSVLELGHLIAIRRDNVFRNKHRLQEGLKALTASDGQLPKVLEGFLTRRGKYQINGLGLNAISKVLAVHAPEKWTVYNRPVAEALKEFGYIAPRGASQTEKFLTFTQMMDTFKTATGLSDAYALDAFFYDVYSRLKSTVEDHDDGKQKHT